MVAKEEEAIELLETGEGRHEEGLTMKMVIPLKEEEEALEGLEGKRDLQMIDHNSNHSFFNNFTNYEFQSENNANN